MALPVQGLLRGRFEQRLLLLSLVAAAAGSALMALITAGSVLVIGTRQAEREDRHSELELLSALTSFQSLAELQRRMQLATVSGNLEQALVLNGQGRVIAASDAALVGLSSGELHRQSQLGSLAEHLRHCGPADGGDPCLRQDLQRFDGPIPVIGGDHLLRIRQTPLALVGQSDAHNRATLITNRDLRPLVREAKQLGLVLFLLALVPLAGSVAGFGLLLRRRLLQDLLSLAHTDELSGVCNRRAFQELAELILRRSASLGLEQSLAILDIDRFKTINDTYGHAAGDGVIRHLSTVLARGVRRRDLVGRLGGDEFALLLSGGNREALPLLERLRQELQTQPMRLACGTPLPVALSVGLASSASSGHSLTALLGAADQALYSAKRQGRNRVVSATAEQGTKGRAAESVLDHEGSAGEAGRVHTVEPGPEGTPP